MFVWFLSLRLAVFNSICQICLDKALILQTSAVKLWNILVIAYHFWWKTINLLRTFSATWDISDFTILKKDKKKVTTLNSVDMPVVRTTAMWLDDVMTIDQAQAD